MGRARRDTNDPCHTYEMQRACVLGGASVLFAGHALQKIHRLGRPTLPWGPVPRALRKFVFTVIF